MRRCHVTDDEKRKIVKLCKKGLSAAVVARRMGLARSTVSKIRKAAGLPSWPPVPEEKIVALLRAGLGQHRVHKILNVSQPKVHALMVKHGIQNGHATTPKENEERFVAALKRREGYIRTLAKRYRVALCRARRLAHEVLGTVQFRPGASKPPLSSNFPQKSHEKKIGQHG